LNTLNFFQLCSKENNYSLLKNLKKAFLSLIKTVMDLSAQLNFMPLSEITQNITIHYLPMNKFGKNWFLRLMKMAMAKSLGKNILSL
jgi:hypothetical protein